MTASKNGDIGFSDSPSIETKKGAIDIVTFENLIEKGNAIYFGFPNRFTRPCSTRRRR